MKKLKQEDFAISIVEDLGMVYNTTKSTKKVRMAIFSCADCGSNIRKQVDPVKSNKGLRCAPCGRVFSNARTAESNSTHGLKQSPLYEVWRGQIRRCTELGYPSYNKYGGRGINIDDIFLNFQVWYDYVTTLPEFGTPNYTIDREDNDLGYIQGNLRWVSKEVQSQNDRVLMSTNTSGYRGVSFNKASNKWKVKIVVSGVSVHLGYYTDLLEAAKAYDTYVIENQLGHSINEVVL